MKKIFSIMMAAALMSMTSPSSRPKMPLVLSTTSCRTSRAIFPDSSFMVVTVIMYSISAILHSSSSAT